MTTTTMTSQMPRTTMRVWIARPDDQVTFHHVTVRHTDKIAAERALKGLGQNDLELAQTMMTAWAWAALKRTGDYDGQLARFLQIDCEELDLDDPDATGTVDPTQAGAPTDSP
jgi:hypothetical protein